MLTQDTKLIFGLGNPTNKYALTRHNAGFICIDQIVKLLNGQWTTDVYDKCLHFAYQHHNTTIIFIKPLTFMNLSGINVNNWAKTYHVLPENICVIYDDASIEFPKIKIKVKGSGLSTHNGIRSIYEHLKSYGFIHAKIGIATTKLSNNLQDFVLGKFNSEEIAIINNLSWEIFLQILSIWKLAKEFDLQTNHLN